MKKKNDLDFENEFEQNTVPKRRLSRGRYEQIFSIGIIAGIVITLVGAIAYVITQQRYSEAKGIYEEAKETFISQPTPEPELESETTTPSESEVFVPWFNLINIDLVELNSVAKDSIGWIYFENDSISYPIMYSADNEKYLDHLYDGSYSMSGSIFMDMNNHIDFEDPYTILYGHNMKNGTMFGSLKNYRKQDYYDENAYFQIITPSGKYRYQIFSVMTISDNSDYYDILTARDSILDNRIEQFAKSSRISASLTPTREDNFLCLSTCSGSENRLFVVAVLVDSY